MWPRMMARSALADVPSHPRLGALVFISSDQTFQTPPCKSHKEAPAQAPQVTAGVPGRAASLGGSGQLEGPGATWPGATSWSGASLLWASRARLDSEV